MAGADRGQGDQIREREAWGKRREGLGERSSEERSKISIGDRPNSVWRPWSSQVSQDEVTSRRDLHRPGAVRFDGVRYLNRGTWAAEMRPPGSQKISFGDFNSPIKAARAVDAAFHHYGKPDLINFADTSRILSEQPKSAGLDWKEKLKLVKKQANLLASIAGAHDLENIAGIDSSAGIIDSKRISAQKILKKSLTDLRQKKQSNLHQESLYEDPVVLSEQPKLVGLDHWVRSWDL